MSRDDRLRWERRHERASDLKPRASVLDLPAPASSSALALDLACGQGRHARALLRAGYRVVATDVSRLALQHLLTDGAPPDEHLFPVQADADDWAFADGAFDLVVQCDFLDRNLYPRLRACLRPGGLLLIDTFLDQGRPNAEGPSRPAFLLSAGELPREFADFDILHYEELRGATARATLLARKRT